MDNYTLRQVLRNRFQDKQDRITARPGVLGNGYGEVNVPSRPHFVYVRASDALEEVFNNRVPYENDLQVMIGYDPAQPDLFQVLSTRSAAPGGVSGGASVGWPPATHYEWLGDDPVWVDQRLLLPLRIGPYNGMYLLVYRGFVFAGDTPKDIEWQLVNLAPYVPTTSGMAALVLITIDESGTVVVAKGAEVATISLSLANVPSIPANTVKVLGAVRVYYGQTVIAEGATDTDIIDLRSAGWVPAGSTSSSGGPSPTSTGDYYFEDVTSEDNPNYNTATATEPAAADFELSKGVSAYTDVSGLPDPTDANNVGAFIVDLDYTNGVTVPAGTWVFNTQIHVPDYALTALTFMVTVWVMKWDTILGTMVDLFHFNQRAGEQEYTNVSTNVGQPALNFQPDDRMVVVFTATCNDTVGHTIGVIYSTAAGGAKTVMSVPDASGIAQFTDLTDVPTSYVDHAGEVVAVKLDESGLEFVPAPPIPMSSIEDAAINTPATGDILMIRRFRVVTSGVEAEYDSSQIVEITGHGNPALAFDGITSNQWLSIGAGTHVCTIELPQVEYLTKIEVVAQNGDWMVQDHPMSMQVYGSNNGNFQGEEDLMGSGSGWNVGTNTITFDEPRYGYKFYKFVVPNNTNMRLNEIVLFSLQTVESDPIWENIPLSDFITSSPGVPDFTQPWLNVMDYGAIGSGEDDDTSAIQAAIDAAELINAVVYFPKGTYRLTGTLTIDNPISLLGAGVYPLYGSVNTDFNSIDIPVDSPYLAGTVLLMDASDTNVLTIAGAGQKVDLAHFGIRFATPYANTGHGIYAVPPAVSGHHDNGPLGSLWEDITVFGHDGSHYAYYIVNPLYVTCNHLRSFGGGGLYLWGDGAVVGGQQTYYGGMVFEHFYAQLYVNGSAHGIMLTTTTRFGNITWVRPQTTTSNKTSTTGATAPSSSQKIFNYSGNVYSQTILGCDFETNVGSTCSFPSNSFIDPAALFYPAIEFHSDEIGSVDFRAAGLTGATAASRYVGATATGAPSSGTFIKGDFVVDQTGKFWVCTAAGSPGTWTSVGAGHDPVTITDTTTIDLALTGQALSASLKDTTVTAGNYNNPDLTIDAQGRITAASNGNAKSSGELLMQDGVSNPPVPLTTEDGTDWVYQG